MLDDDCADLLDEVLSNQQQIVIIFLDVFSSLLSLIGSTCIVCLILRDRRRKLKKTYHRLLLALSLSDVNNSARGLFSPFLMPADTPGAAYAIGTQGTCTGLGFSTQLGGLMSILYSASLAIFYAISIQPKAKRSLRWVEPIMHFVAISYPLAGAIVGLILDLYNPVPNGVGCWIIAYPWDCDTDPNMECERGENAATLSQIMGGVPTVLAFLIIVMCMIHMYVSVWWQIKVISKRFNTVKGQNVNQNAIYQLRQTGYQAALYILAFIMTNIWTMLLRGFEVYGNDMNISTYPLEVLTVFFFPLQGFWNFFIYVRPRATDLRRQHPDENLFQILNRVFEREPGPKRRQRQSNLRISSLAVTTPSTIPPSPVSSPSFPAIYEQAPAIAEFSNDHFDDSDDDGDAFDIRPPSGGASQEMIPLQEDDHDEDEARPVRLSDLV